jgi:hypothetical protein
LADPAGAPVALVRGASVVATEAAKLEIPGVPAPVATGFSAVAAGASGLTGPAGTPAAIVTGASVVATEAAKLEIPSVSAPVQTGISAAGGASALADPAGAPVALVRGASVVATEAAKLEIPGVPAPVATGFSAVAAGASGLTDPAGTPAALVRGGSVAVAESAKLDMPGVPVPDATGISSENAGAVALVYPAGTPAALVRGASGLAAEAAKLEIPGAPAPVTTGISAVAAGASGLVDTAGPRAPLIRGASATATQPAKLEILGTPAPVATGIITVAAGAPSDPNSVSAQALPLVAAAEGLYSGKLAGDLPAMQTAGPHANTANAGPQHLTRDRGYEQPHVLEQSRSAADTSSAALASSSGRLLEHSASPALRGGLVSALGADTLPKSRKGRHAEAINAGKAYGVMPIEVKVRKCLFTKHTHLSHGVLCLLMVGQTLLQLPNAGVHRRCILWYCSCLMFLIHTDGAAQMREILLVCCFYITNQNCDECATAAYRSACS